MQEFRKGFRVAVLTAALSGGACGLSAAQVKTWEECDGACRTSSSYCESVVYPDYLNRPPAELNACAMGGGTVGEGPVLRASKCLLACAKKFPKKPWWQIW